MPKTVTRTTAVQYLDRGDAVPPDADANGALTEGRSQVADPAGVEDAEYDLEPSHETLARVQDAGHTPRPEDRWDDDHRNALGPGSVWGRPVSPVPVSCHVCSERGKRSNRGRGRGRGELVLFLLARLTGKTLRIVAV